MRTSKPIATISFNSKIFLVQKLTELQRAKKISFWVFMPHLPEDDEGGKKDHCHLYVVPSKLIQTDDLREELKEFDPVNPSLPLGCLPFDVSKFDHWYMYCLHDKRYLAAKGQTRRFHYTHEQFVSCDDDYLLFLSKQIDLTALTPYSDMLDAIDRGLTFGEYFSRGFIPIQQIGNYEKAWKLLTANETFRNGRPDHPNEPTD